MTNGAAIGYMILAARAAGLTHHQIKVIEGNMRSEMDFTTEEEAEEFYNKI